MEDLTSQLSELTVQQKTELLQRVSKELVARSADTGGIAPRPEGMQRVPASPLQEQLWFLDQLAPGQSSYNVASVFRLKGKVEVAALRSAVIAIVDRHEALRTTFATVEDAPVQVVAPVATEVHGLRVESLADVAEAERESEALRRATEEIRRPFDLVRGPLFRSLLISVADDEHLLVLTMHHIVSDGWSQAILTADLSEYYTDRVGGRDADLPELHVQYADYALWQRDQVGGEAHAAQLDYWKRRLTGLPTLEMPSDRPRPATPSYRSGMVSETIGADLLERLRELSAAHDSTLFITLMAAFHMVLARYGGQEDIVVGTATTGRSDSQLDHLIGYFVNMVVLRTDCGGDPTFGELLGRMRRTLLDAWDNQDVPFEKVVEHLAPERDPSRNPLIQVCMQLLGDATSGTEPSLEGVEVASVDANIGGHPFDLTVTGYENPGSLRLVAEFATDLFDADRMQRLLGHLHRVLRTVVEDSGVRLSAIDLLTEDERRALTETWQGSAADPSPVPVHLQVSRIAERHPQAVALRWREDDRWEEMTYARLDERARLLARRLRRCGVGKESIVAVMLERGPDVPVAMLAAQHAGGAFVVVDPAHPRRRLEYILADTAARALVTTTGLLPRLDGADANWESVCVDTDWEREVDVAEPLPQEVDEHCLAYVLYTSGSTGKPKGVMVEHHALSTFLLWMGDELFGLRPGDRVLQHMALIFDFAEGELYAALTRGATMVFAPEETRTDPEGLGRLLEEERINYFNGPPAVLGRVPPVGYPDLKGLIAGGEAVTGELINRWNTEGRRFINGYGPTEAAVGCIFYECEHRVWSGQPPIGRAMPGRVAYVLDRWNNPQPVGVPGEVVVGGHGLARGYLNLPELTAEKFIPDPLRPEELVYRTGDLGQWTADGQIEFLGRLDTQVKLNGLRIELEEIESVLASHPRIREAAVAVRQDEGGGKRLVAYLVPGQGVAAPGLDDLRAHLLEELPPYMVPAAAVTLSGLPLASSGKVDRAALPAPDGDGPAARATSRPGTVAEQRVADIFSAVLEAEEVGVGDSFFELGGTSLQVARVLSRLTESTGVTLSMREFYLTPRVDRLAALLASEYGWDPETAEAARDEPVEPEQTDDSDQLRSQIAELEAQLAAARAKLQVDRPPLSPAQEQLWFLDRLAPGEATYNIQVPLRLTGPLDADALHRALIHIVDRHPALRTTFHDRDGVPYAQVSEQTDLPLPVDDLTAMPAAEIEAEALRILREDAATAFDLSADLMLRAKLVRLGDSEHLLSLNLHHICSDGWSANILSNELVEAYEAVRRGRQPSLEPLPTTYAEFASDQRRRLDSGDLDRVFDYWVDQLADLPTVDLPADRSRPATQSYRGAQLVYRLPQEIRDGLHRLAASAPASAYAALLAGFTGLISRYTEAEDVPVGTADAGRYTPETEPLIGFFVNMLVLRVDLSGDPSYRELIGRCMSVIFDALEHREAPFEKLVERLEVGRDPSRNPLFSFSIDLVEGEPGGKPLPGLATEFLDVDPGVSRFDMAINAYDQSDGITLRIEYSTDLFDADRIERMFSHLEHLLRSAIAAPDLPLSELDIIDEAESTLLLDWGRGASSDHPRRPLPELIDERARRDPSAVAIVSGSTTLTYAELVDEASRVATALGERGVGVGDTVAVELPRGVDFIVAQQALLRLGAVYAPVDPEYPEERRRFQAGDMAARFIITAESWEALRDRARTADPLDMPAGLSAEADACLIYTSGSTGKPKGVPLAHYQLAHFADWMAKTVDLGPGDAMLHCCNPTFDVAQAEMLSALTSGARVVCAAGTDGLRPDRLTALVAEQGVTHLFTTPTVLRLIEPGAYPELRYVLTAGEPCPIDLVSAWNVRPRRYLNLYGPAECSVSQTFYDIPVTETSTEPPIGRPITNAHLYVLDRRGRLAPVGVPGEIVLGGLGVASGYLNRPELTAERFVPDPFRSGGSVYRTGDLGMWSSQGQLRFLGRADRQVKVRGLRIETGEVECALREHPGVSNAAVVAAADRQALLAYVVAVDTERRPADADLRSHLARTLPLYMVPSHFIAVEALPRNANGKLDLPDTPPRAVAAGAADMSEAEREVAAVFASILDAASEASITPSDGFFALGGTSLKAIQAAARLSAEDGVEVSVRDFYTQPTVSDLARLLERRRGEAAEDATAARSVVLLSGSGRADRLLWLVHPISGSPFVYHDLGQELPDDLDVMGLAAPGLDGEAEPVTGLGELAEVYVRAIRDRQPDGPYRLAGWSMGGFVATEAARQLSASGREVSLVALIDSADPGPLPPPDDAEILRTFAADMASSAGLPAPDLSGALPSTVDERVEQVRRALLEGGVLTPDVTSEFLRARYRVFTANMRAMYRYRPQPFEGELVQIRAADEGGRRGWERFAKGGFSLSTVPGDHYSMWNEQHRPALCAELSRLLSERP